MLIIHRTKFLPPAMDAWKEFAALEEGRDVVRRWAALEGKSRTMSADLCREYSLEEREQTRGASSSFALHIGALIVELWRLMRSGL